MRERRNFYRAVFENTGTAMMVIEEDSIISIVNEECERMSGYSRAEIEGKKRWMEFVADEDREQMMAWHRLRREYRENVPLNYEFTLVNRDGERRRIYLTVDLIPGTKRSVASLIDITERIMAEDALRRSEALHRTIFEISPDPIALIDTEGTLVRTSPSALRLFGLESGGEAIGTPLFDWNAPENRDEVKDRVLAFIRSGASPAVASLYHLVKKDGTRFYGEISSSVLLGSDGKPEGLISIIRDVTDRIAIENALKKANEKLNLLAAITRHDILNNLTILLGYIELAQDENDMEALREYLAKIKTSAATVGAQVQLSRDYQNLGMDVPCWQSVSDLVQASMHGLEFGKVRVSNQSGLLEIFSDPLFSRVIYNLFDNALRHGRMLTTITMRYENDDPDLLLILEDDGTGIPQAEKEKIFTKGYGNNTGLGLFVAREILAITGLTISETGMPGKGARFVIRIPSGQFRCPNPG